MDSHNIKSKTTTTTTTIIIIIIIIIQFNSVGVYLCANLTAQRPITKLARIERKTQKYFKKIQNILIILIILTIILYLKIVLGERSWFRIRQHPCKQH
jgi:archaellum biogenesis protein FlaJ (TadC family)